METNASRVLIFVGGIHGIGKSTVCKQICTDLSMEYLLASELINQYKNHRLHSQLDQGKHVKNMLKNQDALVNELNQRVVPGKHFLLDGHFTVLDSKGKIQLIPVSTFMQIAPCAITVLTDDPSAIRKRLFVRDNKEYGIELLASMQEQELSHAREVGNKLGVTVFEFTTNDIDKLKAVMSTHCKDE